jgi:ATP-dependent Lon protease
MIELDQIDKKAASVLDGYLVRKDLVRTFSRQFPVPTYVVEFMLGRYCASTDQEEIDEGLEIVQRQLKSRTVRAGEEELFKAKALETGEVKIIDLVTARVDNKGEYVASLPSLRLTDVRISSELVNQHERMLTGGFYAELGVTFDVAIAQEAKGRPFGITSLREIQLSKRDVLDTLAKARQAFTTEEWKCFLLRSIGIESGGLSDRQRNALLLRMVPFVERNYNLVELGPRGTGKSHLFQQVSPYAHLISGGKATVAKMFVENTAKGRRGLVCQYDVVCFDEVSGISFDQKDGVNIMKGYMESGEFSRGKESIRADGSIVLVGNFDVDVEHQQRVGHLFGPMPPEMRNDTAFMDRIHAFLPGWDVPKINKDLVTNHFGLVSDFLSECWSQLRNQSRVSELQNRVFFGGALSGRDTNAVNKTVSGLLKLLYPKRGCPGPRRRPGMGRSHRHGGPAPRQRAAEAGRCRRVSEHALQLHHGCRRRREVRLHAGAPKRQQHRRRPAGAWVRCGPSAPAGGGELRPLPHRGQRRPRIWLEGAQQAHSARVPREHRLRRAEPVRQVHAVGWRQGPQTARVHGTASGV